MPRKTTWDKRLVSLAWRIWLSLSQCSPGQVARQTCAGVWYAATHEMPTLLLGIAGLLVVGYFLALLVILLIPDVQNMVVILLGVWCSSQFSPSRPCQWVAENLAWVASFLWLGILFGFPVVWFCARAPLKILHWAGLFLGFPLILLWDLIGEFICHWKTTNYYYQVLYPRLAAPTIHRILQQVFTIPSSNLRRRNPNRPTEQSWCRLPGLPLESWPEESTPDLKTAALVVLLNDCLLHPALSTLLVVELVFAGELKPGKAQVMVRQLATLSIPLLVDLLTLTWRLDAAKGTRFLIELLAAAERLESPTIQSQYMDALTRVPIGACQAVLVRRNV